MGEVIEMRGRVRPRDETRAVLRRALEQDTSGELHGSILITDTDEGTRFHALGACRDRLQTGVLTLVRGLSNMVEEIAASGTAGDTQAKGQVDLRWPRRTLPKRLREVTGFGDLR